VGRRVMPGQAAIAVAKVSDDPLGVSTGRDLAAVRRIVLRGLGSLPKRVDLVALEAAVEDRSVARASASLGRDLDLPGLEDVLARAAGRGGVAESRGRVVVQKATIEITYEFDLENPAVGEWAETRAGELIVELDRGTRESIRALVVRALREGGHPRQIARAIRPLIGLHHRWAVAVLNYRFKLEAAGKLSASRIEELTARYYAKLLRARARNIARTEILRATNAGKLVSWVDAYRNGYVGKVVPQKQWVATAGAEEGCAAADGQQVGLFDAFSTTFGNLEMPPAHPSCRCSAVLIVGEGSLG